MPSANWFPDVDPAYLEFSNPAKLDALYADPEWDNANNWITESALYLAYESNYYRNPTEFSPANWRGYTKTVDYSLNPVTGLQWSSPAALEMAAVKIQGFPMLIRQAQLLISK